MAQLPSCDAETVNTSDQVVGELGDPVAELALRTSYPSIDPTITRSLPDRVDYPPEE